SFGFSIGPTLYFGSIGLANVQGNTVFGANGDFAVLSGEAIPAGSISSAAGAIGQQQSSVLPTQSGVYSSFAGSQFAFADLFPTNAAFRTAPPASLGSLRTTQTIGGNGGFLAAYVQQVNPDGSMTASPFATSEGAGGVSITTNATSNTVVGSFT